MTGNPAASLTLDVIRRRVNAGLPPLDSDEPVSAMASVEGWLTAAEAALLARCVAATPAMADARVVEIGSYCGKSTVVIALAIAACGLPLRLTAIDPHTGYVFAGGRDTYQSLIDTLQRNRVEACVDIVRARSTDVVFARQVVMVFIDGLHDADSVGADYRQVAPHVVRGGLLLFHDYQPDFPGVVETVNDIIGGGGHELAGYADSLIALRRL
jgi:predicted O-methyltransferase YrrM